MRLSEIRNMIKEAVRVENKTGNLANVLQQVSRSRGLQLNRHQLDEVSRTIHQYVDHAPALMEFIDKAAKQAGISQQVTPILNAAEQYFFAPMDVIPDHLGILGLVDDAYLTHCLIQGLSDRYHAQTGQKLLPMDLSEINQFIRNLIGEPHASILDASVQGALNGPAIQQALVHMMGAGGGFNLAGPDPIWGNASPSEIANVRLGAMGIF